VTEARQQPTISISIVCTPEQLADVQVRVSAPQAFLAGFAETKHSVHFDPELAHRQRELLEEQGG
jgi:hypothetical protein